MKIEINNQNQTVPFARHWQFCVGSPHATYALRSDWTKQLQTIHDELGIERVRFHGIFCDDMHTYHKATDLFPIPGGSRYTEKSFRWCGAAYDNVLAAGMKPFVELSFMPKHLAKHSCKGRFFYKPIISPPKSYREWSDYIESFLRFLIDRYGRTEVESWYFEVWNEPDLRLPFFAGTQKDYFALYAATAAAVKRVDPAIRVGGPSTSGSKWVPEFIDYCKSHNLPLDFITTHQYAGDPLGGIDDSKEALPISVDPFAALKDKSSDRSILHVFRKMMRTDKVCQTLKTDNLIRSAQMARAQAGSLPLFYTEWNLCASFSAECNDTRMVAAYDVHSILGTGDAIDGSSIWCFTDLFEELPPFAEEFHGGFGMMTQSGIKKPIFHALKFLTEVGDDRIVLPESNSRADVAAFRNDQGIRLIAALPSLNREKMTEKVSVSIECGQEPKAVTVKRIDENHANPLKIWENMGSPTVPTPGQTAQIAEQSEPICEPIPYRYQDGRLQFDFALSENDVLLVAVDL